MQPTLMPARGTPILGLNHAMGLMGRLAQQVSANSFVQVNGMLDSEAGNNGLFVHGDPTPAKIACFEVRSRWHNTNEEGLSGASAGRYWWCDAKLVSYFWTRSSGSSSGDPEAQDTYWDAQHSETQRVYYGVTSVDEQDTWQQVLYSRFCLGQWMWCAYDYQADVWRVIDAYDSIVRFELLEPLVGCQFADAKVLGFVPDYTSSSSSSSAPPPPPPPPQPSGSSSSSVSSSSSSSSSGEATCWPSIDRGTIKIIDMMNIVRGTLATGTRGWAKRMADSNCFEIMWTGASTSVTSRSFVLRTSLVKGGYAVAQELEYKALGRCDVQSSAETVDAKRLCYRKVNGEDVFFIVYDRLNEFEGWADSESGTFSCGFARQLADTPTFDELCMYAFDPPYENVRDVLEIERMVCINHYDCPCQTGDCEGDSGQ